jgi:hypothetical protein
MKRAIIALLFTCSTAQAVDCVVVADGLSAAADAGRRGVPVGTVIDSSSISGNSEATNVTLRLLFLEAFRRGSAGEAVDEIWLDFYGRCKETVGSGKEERPS